MKKAPKMSTSLLTAMLSCILLVVWAVTDLKVHYEEALIRTTADLKNRTQLISEWVKGSYLGSNLRLQDIAEELKADALLFPHPQKDQHRQRTQWLQTKLNHLPGAYFIGVVNRDCVVTHHTNPEVRLGLDVSQRDYCLWLRDQPDEDSMITPLYTTSFGTMTVTQVRRIPGRDGKPAGLVAVGVDMSLFAQFLQRATVSPGEAIAIFDTRLNLIARNPSLNFSSPKVPNTQALVAFSKSDNTELIQHTVSPLDGMTRLAVYRKIEGTPLMVVASEADQRWLEAWKHRIWELSAICLILFVLIGLLLRGQRATFLASQRMQLAIDVGQLGFLSLDLKTGRIKCSELVYEHFGLPVGQPIQKSMLEQAIHPEDATRVQAALSASLKTHDNFDIEYRVLAADGSVRWIRSKGRPQFNQNGVAIRMDGTTQDITEFKSMQQAREVAKEADFMLKQQVASQTVAQMAHELNQPLQAISLSNEVAIQLGEQSGNLDHRHQLKDVLQHSHEQAQRASQVLRRLMTQIHAWRDDQHRPQPFDLNEVIHKVIAEARKEHADVQFDLKLESHLPKAMGLPLQTEKVLVNLVGNAIEAMTTAGQPHPILTVTSRLRPESSQLWVSVRDQGRAMDNMTAANVFDPFFTTKPHGMGLGLAICRSLIQAQGGEIWLERDSLSGADFQFTLPLAPEEAACLKPTTSV